MKTPLWESLFNKVADLKASNFIKKKLQVFFSEYCEIFKNSFFIEHLWWLLPLIDFRFSASGFWASVIVSFPLMVFPVRVSINSLLYSQKEKVRFNSYCQFFV